MTFTSREIRRGMDVFSADGVLLGSVVQIRRRPASAVTVSLTVAASDHRTFSGESLGPAPTACLGNGGPASQNSTSGYAASPRLNRCANAGPPTDDPTDFLVFRTLVHLDWRTLWPRLRRHPVSLILSVSHERIVLAAPASDLH